MAHGVLPERLQEGGVARIGVDGLSDGRAGREPEDLIERRTERPHAVVEAIQAPGGRVEDGAGAAGGGLGLDEREIPEARGQLGQLVREPSEHQASRHPQLGAEFRAFLDEFVQRSR